MTEKRDWTKEKKAVLAKIKKDIQNYIASVNNMGNECAWTDRMIENIVAHAKELDKIQREQFKYGEPVFT